MNRDHNKGQAGPVTEEPPERAETLLDVIGGQRGLFFGDLSKKYGLAEQEARAERYIDEWRKRFRL